MEITDSIKEKVEVYFRKYEGTTNFVWGEDSCSTFDENNQYIGDYMIDIEDGVIFYTSVSCYGVTLVVE